jgi:hypothetical protein
VKQIMGRGNFYVRCIALNDSNRATDPLKGGGGIGSLKQIAVCLIISFE